MDKLTSQFELDRDRRRDTPIEPSQAEASPTHWIDQAVGQRYQRCTLDGFETPTAGHVQAVEKCRDYVKNFGKYAQDGISLILSGPRGTGKDHLMVATIRAICFGFGPRQTGQRRRVVYRDGLTLFAEFRSAIRSHTDEDRIVSNYVEPYLLALSDPLPPIGSLSEYERRMIHRIVDGRYRECRPIAATVNVANREELDARMTPQTADRLCDMAVAVRCNWESYRQRKVES